MDLINTNIHFRKNIPSILSIIRIIIAPVFLISFINSNIFLATTLFVFALITDVLDGYIARNYGLKSPIGAYLDVVADFILIMVVFVAFTLKEIYPFWVLIIFIAMFSQFILTSRKKIIIYDPVGKYYGSFLFSVIVITLILDNANINYILLLLIVILSVISFISRLFFIIRSNKIMNL
jgi:CDP-diacylglycerol--glycerol-3-phosphate 3-phosphatidyltransferase/cardiolipin synthase